MQTLATDADAGLKLLNSSGGDVTSETIQK